eukprot:TRINITY_DN4888_c0_g1_i1.p1 TRINITY_DN4888_c0_g1~~TRINITY_DN4888_c0_g1_i1.p1  ORF type:complete len:315 (-),score=57.66 TRINITY_DN4888_c0_g1_i1:26-970(-)
MPSLVFLGTSAATPTKMRNVTSHALRMDDGKIFLLDCGEGTQHQFLKSNEVKSSKIEAFLITHLHGDHSFGLPGLLASMSLLGRSDPVKCFGPKGIKPYIESFLQHSATYLTFPFEIIELEVGKVAPLGVISGVTITAYPLRHKVPCFGYILQEPEKRGKLDAQKAKQLGATGKDMGLLTAGKDVTTASGQVIRAVDVIGETRKGKKYVLLGDTSNSDSMLPDAEDCDVLVHETTYDASLQEKAVEGGHSTSKMAGEFANRIRAKKLFITHFSMRYDTESTEGAITVNDLLNETQRECPDTVVTAAEDFRKYEI